MSGPASTHPIPKDIWKIQFDLMKDFNKFALIGTAIATIATFICAISIVAGSIGSGSAEMLSNFGAVLAGLGSTISFAFQVKLFIMPKPAIVKDDNTETNTREELNMQVGGLNSIIEGFRAEYKADIDVLEQK